jgi:hypothetical protein
MAMPWGFLGPSENLVADQSFGILTDAAKPRLEGSRVGGSFRIEDFRTSRK